MYKSHTHTHTHVHAQVNLSVWKIVMRRKHSKSLETKYVTQMSQASQEILQIDDQLELSLRLNIREMIRYDKDSRNQKAYALSKENGHV